LGISQITRGRPIYPQGEAMKDYRQEILDALRGCGRILKRDYRRRYLPALERLIAEGRVQVVMDDASHNPDAPRRSRAWIELRLSAAQRAAVLKLSLLDPGFEHHWDVLCDPRCFDLSSEELKEVFNAARVGVDWHADREVSMRLDEQLAAMGRRKLVPEPSIQEVIASEPDLSEVQRLIDDEAERRRVEAQRRELEDLAKLHDEAHTNAPPPIKVCTHKGCDCAAYDTHEAERLFGVRKREVRGEQITSWQPWCRTCRKRAAVEGQRRARQQTDLEQRIKDAERAKDQEKKKTSHAAGKARPRAPRAMQPCLPGVL
jgi:hypothetical protein